MSIYRKEGNALISYGNDSGQDSASEIDIIDTEGLVTTAGATTNIQALTDEIADRSTKAAYIDPDSSTPSISDPELHRSDISTSQINSDTRVPSASLVYGMNDSITQVNNDKADKWTLVYTATANGTKTHSQLLAEIYSTVSSDLNNIFKYVVVQNDSRIFRPFSKTDFCCFSPSDISYANMLFRVINLSANCNIYSGNNTLSLSAYGSEAASSGSTYKLYKIG